MSTQLLLSFVRQSRQNAEKKKEKRKKKKEKLTLPFAHSSTLPS